MVKAILILSIALAVLFISTPSAEARKSSFGGSSRSYSKGGSLYLQKGYLKKNGTYVQPHLKTKPDNTIYNNRKYRLGY